MTDIVIYSSWTNWPSLLLGSNKYIFIFDLPQFEKRCLIYWLENITKAMKGCLYLKVASLVVEQSSPEFSLYRDLFTLSQTSYKVATHPYSHHVTFHLSELRLYHSKTISCYFNNILSQVIILAAIDIIAAPGEIKCNSWDVPLLYISMQLNI